MARKPFPWGAVFGLCIFSSVVVLAFSFGLSLCPFRNLLGIPCPGCGLSRASIALLQLRPVEALRLHPLVLLLAPLTLWLFASPIFRYFGVASLFRAPSWLRGTHVWTAILALVLATWIWRLGGGLGGHPDPIDPGTGLISRYLWSAGS